jgi:DNA-cytosine methyltransferase
MNVLSLFDGIACGLVALKRIGIQVDNYYASEIDKHAIKVAIKNHPEIIELGDVRNWREWNLPKIDLLIGGSPCQGFSFAGKQLNFEDERSKLFFDYVDILNELKPTYFLLENVMMKKEYEDVITQELGVYPISINSSLVSAQERKRIYWTNIDVKGKSKDKNIFLKDIIEKSCPGDILKNTETLKLNKEILKRDVLEKLFYVGLNKKYSMKKGTILTCQIVNDTPSKLSRTGDRIYHYEGKSPTITTNINFMSYVMVGDGFKDCRKLTPVECERLQTLPDNYTKDISETQRYRCLGNGWTVDVIAHIFSFLNLPPKQRLNIPKQLSLF